MVWHHSLVSEKCADELPRKNAYKYLIGFFVFLGSQMTQTLPSSSPGDCPLSTCVLTNSEDVLLPGN